VRHYGNVRRWRGGQLTLNAVTLAASPFSPYALEQVGAAKLRFLPCDTFNYSWDYSEHPGPEQFAGRWVVHLKGARKDALEVLRAALTLPARQAPLPSYSLDTIAPTDYEPQAPLDYGSATLGQIADHFKTDKGSIKHRYTDTYERYLLPWRGKRVDLLEIGVACGASLKTWACWLGGEARVTGIDIRPACAKLCSGYPAVRIVIADATSWQAEGDYDVIVDDGSHVSLEIVKAFRNLWPRVRRGGYYVIEDLRCTHDPDYARNFTFPMSPDAFRREHLMAWLDQLLRRMDYLASDIEFMHAYPQMLIMRKR
jgi:methyltransferase family protein